MKAEVEQLLTDREAQGLSRTVTDPTALRRVANVIVVAVAPRGRIGPKDAA